MSSPNCWLSTPHFRITGFDQQKSYEIASIKIMDCCFCLSIRVTSLVYLLSGVINVHIVSVQLPELSFCFSDKHLSDDFLLQLYSSRLQTTFHCKLLDLCLQHTIISQFVYTMSRNCYSRHNVMDLITITVR